MQTSGFACRKARLEQEVGNGSLSLVSAQRVVDLLLGAFH